MSMFFLIASMVMALTLGGVGTVTLATGRVAVPWLRNVWDDPVSGAPASCCWQQGSRPRASYRSRPIWRSCWVGLSW